MLAALEATASAGGDVPFQVSTFPCRAETWGLSRTHAAGTSPLQLTVNSTSKESSQITPAPPASVPG